MSTSRLNRIADAVCYLSYTFAACCAAFAIGVWALPELVVPAVGAPVPPPPREVSAELLAGATWQLEWAELRDGWITFNADGTYCGTHAPDEIGVMFFGTWSVEGGRLVLDEQEFAPALGRVCGPWRREIALSTRRFPRLEGATTEGVRVALSDPQR